ncbi:site-specific integrase, partial [Streptococcus intermedius]
MKRELLLEKIEKLKTILPWYVLEYYQSKLTVPYSFTTLYEYLKEYNRFFQWILDSGIADVSQIAEIPLSVLENMTKKDMESFILYLRERPLLNANTTQNGVSQTTINRTLSALSSLYKYLTEEVENENGEPYFYRNVMKKVSTKKKKETLAARAENIKQKLFLGTETEQ